MCIRDRGKATDKTAGCTLFPGNLVAGAGWCSAWAKKANTLAGHESSR